MHFLGMLKKIKNILREKSHIVFKGLKEGPFELNKT